MSRLHVALVIAAVAAACRRTPPPTPVAAPTALAHRAVAPPPFTHPPFAGRQGVDAVTADCSRGALARLSERLRILAHDLSQGRRQDPDPWLWETRDELLPRAAACVGLSQKTHGLRVIPVNRGPRRVMKEVRAREDGAGERRPGSRRRHARAAEHEAEMGRFMGSFRQISVGRDPALKLKGSGAQKPIHRRAVDSSRGRWVRPSEGYWSSPPIAEYQALAMRVYPASLGCSESL